MTARNAELAEKAGKTGGDPDCENERKTMWAAERRENSRAGAVLNKLNQTKIKNTNLLV